MHWWPGGFIVIIDYAGNSGGLPIPPNAILTEDGNPILTESGNDLLTES
jgi:hypothetical protein